MIALSMTCTSDQILPMVYTTHWGSSQDRMSGKLSNITQFCQFEWFERVMIQDGSTSYQENYLTIGRYLGPNIDVVLAMMAKVLSRNYQVFLRHVYHALT